MARITKASLAILASTVLAMSVEATPYSFVSPTDAAQLLKEKLVEQNADIKDGDKLATRATEAGLKLHAEQANAAPVAAAPSIAVVRAGAEGAVSLDLDAFVKRSRSSSNYDFDGMNKGDYFFIEATDARPNPAKSIASTVSAANKKFGDELPEDQRRTYVVAPFTAGEAKGGYTAATAGALVVRTK